MPLGIIKHKEDYLSAALESSGVADFIYGKQHPKFSIEQLLTLCFYPQPTLAFRSAWILESWAEHFPEKFAPFIPQFLSGIATQQNRSCQRHYTKILMFITHPKAPECYKKTLTEDNRDLIIYWMFEWMSDRSTPVAISTNCMDILFALSAQVPEVREELKHQIELLLELNPTPSILSRSKKWLSKL